MRLALALEAAAELARRLRFQFSARGRPRAARVEAVGSARRGAAAPRDLDLLATTPRAGRGAPALSLAPARAGDRVALVAVAAAGPRRQALVVRAPGAARLRVDVFLATPAERPFALFHFTGSAAYNVRVRALARRRGWRLNQYGLFRAASGRPVAAAARVRGERALARLLGVRFRAPADRLR